MINKKFIEQLKADYRAQETDRRPIIAASNEILFNSKKIIFALHRHDLKLAGAKLTEIEKDLIALAKKYGSSRLDKEGAYHAALEEYTEAKLLDMVITGQPIDKIKNIKLDQTAYLGGICDLLGEMVRLATNEAAAGHFEKIEQIKKTADEIMSALVDFDLTGYLRTKYDQARGHLRKIEQMAYEIKLRVK
jgi:predicted translin family RNA/ssDNA-binding protein